VSGVLLFDKPRGLSSNHALQAVKRLYRADKAGHAGTLDPLASGLLPVFLGDSTRFSSYLLDADKRYETELELGVTTRTGDAEGEVVERKGVQTSLDCIASVIERFRGPQTQIPPMYSALKREGTPLYMLARRGETVERLPRSIDIKLLNILEFSSPILRLDVVCSKGTYIRTLGEDIGEALGCGAHLRSLRRTATGGLRIESAVSLEALQELAEDERDRHLIAVDRLLENLPRIGLDAEPARRLLCGQNIPFQADHEGVCRVYGPDDRFLGLCDAVEGHLIPKRLMPDLTQSEASG
jgi:tRNA pseudouridine55 synthase